MKDCIEFYDEDGLLAIVDSTIVPPVGSKINILCATWEVTSVIYNIDYDDKTYIRRLRVSIYVQILN